MKNIKISLYILIVIIAILLVQKIWNPELINNIFHHSSESSLTQKTFNNISNDINISRWKTYSDFTLGFSFKYPENISTTYIHTVDWPPKLAITPGDFNCVQAGVEIERAGQTILKKINNKDYCITKESEGAAGSIYTMYAYNSKVNGKVVSLTFSLRFVQCDNYDDPEKSACKIERDGFDIDPTVNKIFETLIFN